MILQVIRVLENGPIPFDHYLIAAGNTAYDMNEKDAGKVIGAVRKQVEKLNGEHVNWVPDQIKLFAVGAVFSQLMQMKDGHLDGHDGE